MSWLQLRMTQYETWLTEQLHSVRFPTVNHLKHTTSAALASYFYMLLGGLRQKNGSVQNTANCDM